MKHGVLLLLLAGVAILTVWANPGLPDGADVSIHYWRAFNLEHLWGSGNLTARWSDLYYYGYGAPAFQYTAPGFYGLAVLVGKLPLVDDVARLKLVWSFGILLGAWGTFRYVARRWSVPAGYVSAAAFSFAPTLLAIEPLARGSFGVVFGMGCMALALAYLDAFIQTRRGGVIAVAGLVGLLLSHNLTAVAGMTVLAAYLLWHTRRTLYWHYGWGALLVACGLSAFFWIPVALERDLVRLGSMAANQELDWRTNFIGLGRLLQPVEPFDTRLQNNGIHPQLGLPHWPLAAAALITLWWRKGRGQVLFWLLATLGAVVLITPFSAWLWARVPTLQQFLFPLRFLNVAALGIAILAGIAADRLRVRWGWLALVALIVAGGLYGAGWRWRDFPADATRAGYIQHEKETRILGGTAGDEFLPESVHQIPNPTAFVEASVTLPETPTQRVNPSQHPGVEMLDTSPTRTRFRITLDETGPVEVLQFAFPGWQATLDDEPIPIDASDPFGFMMIDVPAGTHTVTIHYPLTRPQQAGITISLLSVVVLAVGVIYLRRQQNEPLPPLTGQVDARFFVPLLLMLYGLALLSALGYWGYTRSPDDRAIRADHRQVVNFADEATLRGYDFERSISRRAWRVQLYWDFDVGASINGYVHLLDDEGNIIAQANKLNVNAGVEDGMLWRDTYDLEADAPGTPADVRVGLWRCLDDVNRYDCDQRQPLPVLTEPYANPDGWLLLDE